MSPKTIKWLASYPKSGNTWARAFLRAYQYDAYEPIDVNKISRISRSESRLRYFQYIAGTGEQPLTNEEIDALRKPVQELIAQELGVHQVVKTHNARIVHNSVPLIRDELSQCAIYLVRNPLDVVDSLADHNGITIDQAIELMNDPTHTIGSPSDELVTQYLGTWSNHVYSWLSATAFPVLVVRYEDLLASPKACFGQVIAHLGWHFDEDRLERAIKFSSFKTLKKVEEQQGFNELSGRSKSKTFFRKGGTGKWRETLTNEQIDQICRDHHDVMKMLSYL